MWSKIKKGLLVIGALFIAFLFYRDAKGKLEAKRAELKVKRDKLDEKVTSLNREISAEKSSIHHDDIKIANLKKEVKALEGELHEVEEDDKAVAEVLMKGTKIETVEAVRDFLKKEREKDEVASQ